MSHASLMLHLELGQSNAGLLQLGAELARRLQAGAIGIVVCQPLQVLYGEAETSVEQVVRDRAQIDAQVRVAEAEFRAALNGQAQALEWRAEVSYGALVEVLACQARSADLVLSRQAAGDGFDVSRAVNTGALALQLGRPLLVVPAHQEPRKIERVLIGWKDSRETRRAVLDALPLLKLARQVAVQELAGSEELAGARRRVAEVAGWLRQHGIEAEPIASAATGDNAAQLLHTARQQDADLIVAGAYGHSRLREWALGGMTRELLLQSEHCLLLSH